MKTKVVTHLKAHVELYDSLLVDVDGVSTGGAKADTLIDPIWKRAVIDALMRNFEAGLSD